jgi:hypothetical protein
MRVSFETTKPVYCPSGLQPLAVTKNLSKSGHTFPQTIRDRALRYYGNTSAGKNDLPYKKSSKVCIV